MQETLISSCNQRVSSLFGLDAPSSISLAQFAHSSLLRGCCFILAATYMQHARHSYPSLLQFLVDNRDILHLVLYKIAMSSPLSSTF